MTGHANSLHDTGGTLIVLTSEQIDSDGLQGVLVDKAPQDEAVGLVARRQVLCVKCLTLLLFEDED